MNSLIQCQKCGWQNSDIPWRTNDYDNPLSENTIMHLQDILTKDKVYLDFDSMESMGLKGKKDDNGNNYDLCERENPRQLVL